MASTIRTSTIKIARGLRANMPSLADGQIYFCTDTGEFYIGNSGNKAFIELGTLERAGMVRLNNSINSTSMVEAATPSAVKQAYDTATSAGQVADNANQAAAAAQSTANTAQTTVNARVAKSGDTMTGQLTAGGTQAVDTAQVRNIRAGTDDLEPGSSALNTGEIYYVYE